MIDYIAPDFPDSVYIARLAAIPTTVELTYNRVVKNYIDAYTKKNVIGRSNAWLSRTLLPDIR
jgi:hypothetical protein